MADDEEEFREDPELAEVDGQIDPPSPPSGLGALGQLATAVLVVAVLLLAFIGGSVVLRRVFD